MDRAVKAASGFPARDPGVRMAERLGRTSPKTGSNGLDLAAPSMRSVEPVIQRAPGDTRKAISSAISSGSP
jgi:hypothetical protein